MKLFLAALTLWSLPLVAMNCGSANLQTPSPPKTKATPAPSVETVTLTSEHPTGSFAVQPDLLKHPPAILEASVTNVVNPAAKPVNIFVSLALVNERGAIPGAHVTVGSFSLYPADRPGKFLLDAADALQTAGETKNPPDAKEWRLVFELEKQPEVGSSTLEVTLAAPNWKTAKN